MLSFLHSPLWLLLLVFQLGLFWGPVLVKRRELRRRGRRREAVLIQAGVLSAAPVVCAGAFESSEAAMALGLVWAACLVVALPVVKWVRRVERRVRERGES